MKDSCCSYCGTKLYDLEYPKRCSNCREFAWGNPIPVVVVILPILNLDGHAGLIIQKRNIEPQKNNWALTSGYINNGEAWRDAASRETMEEIGLKTDPNNFEIYNVVSGKDHSILLIFCVYNSCFSASDLLSFQPNNEVQAVDIMMEAKDLAFPSHTQIANNVLKYIDSMYGQSYSLKEEYDMISEESISNFGTKELAKQMSLMVDTPEVQVDVERVVNALGAFKRDQSGNVVRQPAVVKYRCGSCCDTGKWSTGIECPVCR